MKNHNIALVGNPNVGKTTVYNRITQSFEHVGNWHGVTVEKASKDIKCDGEKYRITDLPGMYSLTPYTPEEEVSRDEIYNGGQDVLINVCEVNNLPRNLYLTLQLLESGKNVLLAVNMINELKAQKLKFDGERLSCYLGIEVVPLDLKFDADKLLYTAANAQKSKHNYRYLSSIPISEVCAIIGQNAQKAGFVSEYAAIKVLEHDKYIIDKLSLSSRQWAQIAALGEWKAKIATARYDYIDEITQGAICNIDNDRMPTTSIHRKIDKIVLNKYLAFPIFIVVMLLIFILTFGEIEIGGNTYGLIGYWLKRALSLLIFDTLQSGIFNWLTGIGATDGVVSLICHGIIGGVGSVLVFLPQITLLFFFLAVLEDSGYISRVAYMTDGLFGKIGLSGRSVFTMLMGFGCSATAVLTSRGLDDEMMRKKTVLLTPFMSCSARLPVYLAIGGAYFASGKILVVAAMYILGIAVSLAIAAILEHTRAFKSGTASFIMEMPPYRMPTGTRVAQLLWHNVKSFLIKVGTVIFLLNIVIFILSHFSFSAAYVGEEIEKSVLGSIASVISVVFMPLGFGNPKAVIALISGVVAKEGVIATIDTLGGTASVFTGAYSSAAAFAFMTFTLLYIPCFATLSAIKKEVGTRWMVLCIVTEMSVAYMVSLAFYWLGVLAVHNIGIFVSILAVIVLAITIAIVVNYIIRKKGRCLQCAVCGGCKSAQGKNSEVYFQRKKTDKAECGD